MTDLIKSMYDAVQRQGYEVAYIPQVIPILGAVVSVATAIVSFCMMIFKGFQAIYQWLADGKPLLRPKNNASMDSVQFPLEDAGDLGLIFLDNVANIPTLGFLNCFFVIGALSQVVLNKGVNLDD